MWADGFPTNQAQRTMRGRQRGGGVFIYAPPTGEQFKCSYLFIILPIFLLLHSWSSHRCKRLIQLLRGDYMVFFLVSKDDRMSEGPSESRPLDRTWGRRRKDKNEARENGGRGRVWQPDPKHNKQRKSNICPSSRTEAKSIHSWDRLKTCVWPRVNLTQTFEIKMK